jgi:hypothetical protein
MQTTVTGTDFTVAVTCYRCKTLNVATSPRKPTPTPAQAAPSANAMSPTRTRRPPQGHPRTSTKRCGAEAVPNREYGRMVAMTSLLDHPAVSENLF